RLHQRIADPRALREQEGEGHGPADEDAVAAVEQCVDHAELVADLRATEDGDERARHAVAEQLREHLDLAEEQPAARARQDARRGGGGGGGGGSVRAPGARRRTLRSRRGRRARRGWSRTRDRRWSPPIRTGGSPA